MSDIPRPPFYINEYFHAPRVLPADMDTLWANGWRHFGTYFFRYNLTVMAGTPKAILALRTDLAAVTLSKSQRRNLRRNSDLQLTVQPLVIDDAKQALFARHRERFDENQPPDIYTFVDSHAPHDTPCPCLELTVHHPDGRLLAVSFLDVGQEAVSSVYALFDPAESQRGLGIYTMLMELACRRIASLAALGSPAATASRTA